MVIVFSMATEKNRQRVSPEWFVPSQEVFFADPKHLEFLVVVFHHDFPTPIESMYGIYANIGGILMVNVTIYSIHGSYGTWKRYCKTFRCRDNEIVGRNPIITIITHALPQNRTSKKHRRVHNWSWKQQKMPHIFQQTDRHDPTKNQMS